MLIKSSSILNTTVFGLRGQRLGYAECLIVDPERGRTTHVLLVTRWQKIAIPWKHVRFDPTVGAFRLRTGIEAIER
jgi:hypothetical protein